ncbi:DUF4328 domain-containing protein [Litoribacter populi]|uniref:DUF4328 domain-containing protein n=1 Tax=Litoribacter populi TaxID=2598460 RepID=UPI00117E6872|nr:DUF4328 domain-containing protein [Litoribacter populi]
MGQVLQNDYRAYRVLSILAIVFFLTLSCLFFSYLELQMLSGMTSRNAIPSMMVDLRQGLLGNLQIIFLIGAAYLFVKWFKTAYHNLHQIDTKSLAFNERWSIVCWLMPIYNFYHPYQIMKEIWVKTQEFNYGTQVQRTPLIDLWWVLCVINVIGRIVYLRLAFHADTVLEIHNATQMGIFMDLLGLFTLFITFSLIHKVMEFERDLITARQNLIGA